MTDNYLFYDNGHCVFSDCLSLTAITLPDSLTSLGEYAFCSECNGGMFRGWRDGEDECADEVERVFLGGLGEVESTDANEVLRLSPV